MKCLALDLGQARIGIAASDADGRLAFARTALTRSSYARDLASLRRLVVEEQAERLVVGLPLRSDGVEGDRALAARRMGERLAGDLGLPVAFSDERNSSEEARDRLRSLGLDERRIRGRIDAESASVILQRLLDSEQGSAP